MWRLFKEFLMRDSRRMIMKRRSTEVKKQQALRRSAKSGLWLRLTIGGISLGLMLFCSCAKKNTTASSVTPEQLRKDLTAGMKVHGTAVLQSHSESLGFSHYTYQRWQLNIALEDSTPYEVALGNDLFLIESNPEASAFEGTGYYRGQTSQRFSFSYPFNNYEVHYVDGGYLRRLGGVMTITTIVKHTRHKQKSSEEEPLDFGRLVPDSTILLNLVLDEGSWLKPELLASVRVVLPEMTISTKNGKEHFRLTIFFNRPHADSTTWNITRQELTHLQHDELAKLFETMEANAVSRIFAAHWLAELDSNKAGPILAGPSRSLKQGEILATGLDLLTETKSPDLAEHALGLLNDNSVPNGIRSRSALYLGTIHHEPALPVLITALNDKEEAIARGAIRGLGAYGGKQAATVLAGLLQKKKNSDRASIIAEALLRTNDSAAISVLEGLASSGNEASFDALVEGGRPECFEFFEQSVRTGKHQEWREKLIRGMKASGGTKALGVFVDLLSTEKQPTEGDMYTSTLVDEMISLNPEPVRQNLVDLARKGNLRALQVLAGWENEGTRDVLLEITKNGSGLARRIALGGIAENWPNECRDVLHTMLHTTDAELTCSAIEGLGNTGDSREVDSLVSFLDNSNESIRTAASTAIGKLGPGDHASAILKIILKSDDYSLATNLTNALVGSNWSDQTVVKPLVQRLETASGDMRFQVVRLLRHLSKNAMGPETYSQWSDKPEEWTDRWRAWAAKQ